MGDLGKLIAPSRPQIPVLKSTFLLIGLTRNHSTYNSTRSNKQAAGGFFVPILHTHPVPEMTYIVENSEASTLIVHESLEEKGRELAEKAGYVELLAHLSFCIDCHTC